MDTSARSISRISKAKILNFPTDPDKVVEGLGPLFQIVWKVKSVMENTIDLLNSQDPSGEIDIITRPNLVSLPPYLVMKKGRMLQESDN